MRLSSLVPRWRDALPILRRQATIFNPKFGIFDLQSSIFNPEFEPERDP